MQYQQQQPAYQQAPTPQVVVVNTQSKSHGNCPMCKDGHMFKVRKFGCWTCCVMCFCAPYLCMKCAWVKKMKCVACGHAVNI
eukprot:403359509